MATYVHASDGRKFVAHVSLLSHYSPFFSRALNGEFAESESRVIEIHDVAEWVLQVFQTWLYFGTHWWWNQDSWKATTEFSQCQLVELLCFADKYDVPKLLKLQGKWLGILLNRATGVESGAILFAQAHLPETSPILEMLAEALAHFGLHPDDEEKEEEFMAKLKPAFAALVMKKVLEGCNRRKAESDRVTPGPGIDVDKYLADINERAVSESESDNDNDNDNDEDDDDDDEDEDGDDNDDEDEAMEGA